jgi:hypothetical protein
MISGELAAALQRNGLDWTPRSTDVCRLPDGTTKTVADLAGATAAAALTEHGMVWLPSDAQLRDLVGIHLVALGSTPEGHRCEIRVGGRSLVFEAAQVGEALGAAVLQLLADGWLPRPAVAPLIVLDAGGDF